MTTRSVGTRTAVRTAGASDPITSSMRTVPSPTALHRRAIEVPVKRDRSAAAAANCAPVAVEPRGVPRAAAPASAVPSTSAPAIITCLRRVVIGVSSFASSMSAHNTRRGRGVW